MEDAPQLSAEDLGYWFFRLNGCLTIRNFILHREGGGQARTDADVIAVRFPNRQEMDMVDHSVFPRDAISLQFAEIKSSGGCRLNGAWSNPAKRNLPRALLAVGAYPRDRVNGIADALYARGEYRESGIDCRLVLIAAMRNRELERKYPAVVQLTWADISAFIFHRLKAYEKEKFRHTQWDHAGHRLYDLACRTETSEFLEAIGREFKVKVVVRGGDSRWT